MSSIIREVSQTRTQTEAQIPSCLAYLLISIFHRTILILWVRYHVAVITTTQLTSKYVPTSHVKPIRATLTPNQMILLILQVETTQQSLHRRKASQSLAVQSFIDRGQHNLRFQYPSPCQCPFQTALILESVRKIDIYVTIHPHSIIAFSTGCQLIGFRSSSLFPHRWV